MIYIIKIGSDINNIANIKNIIRSGIKTINQAIPEEPALHIKFNIQVQNRIYANLTANIKYVLETLQCLSPKQYVFTLP